MWKCLFDKTILRTICYDHDLMEHIVTQTNLYASTRDGRRGNWIDLTVPEFQAFLGTMILNGDNQVALFALLLVR